MTQVRVAGGSGVSLSGTFRLVGTYVGEFNPSDGIPVQGSGKNGRILKGDFWRASGSGTITGVETFTDFTAGDLLFASANNATLSNQFFGVRALGDGGSESVFASDVTFVLSGSKTFGKYSNGDTAEWTGLTAIQALIDAAIEYINPAFSSFSVSGQSNTVEVGTTLSGSKTFTWAITLNSGTVPTIDIYDITDSNTLLAGTSNDGSQVVTVATLQLNSSGATQQWKGIANNTDPVGTVDSNTFTVTSRFYRFYGASASSPANSADVRALPSSAFHTSGSFTLNTGTSLTKFVVALPPGVTISSVIDTSALNADITSEYVLTGTVSVLDAGSTNRTYNIYEMNIGSPYGTSHSHSITTS